MDISAITTAAQPLQGLLDRSSPTAPHAPDPDLRAAFQAAVSAPEAVPEQPLTHTLMERSQSIGDVLNEAVHLSGNVSPEQMLSMQAALTRASLDVEVTAKVAGAVSQAINRLVNLQ